MYIIYGNNDYPQFLTEGGYPKIVFKQDVYRF